MNLTKISYFMIIRIIIFVLLGNLCTSAPYCLQYMIPSSTKSSKHVLNEFFSYFNTENSDSTTAVPGKTIASPPLKAIKCRKQVFTDSHPSEKACMTIMLFKDLS